MENNKKVIGVVQVLQHLKDGMTREEIGTEYGLTKGEVKLLFQDSRLKGKKTQKKPSFTLVEDTSAGIDEGEAPVIQPKEEEGVSMVKDTPVEEVEVKEEVVFETKEAPVEEESGEEVVVEESANSKASWD